MSCVDDLEKQRGSTSPQWNCKPQAKGTLDSVHHPLARSCFPTNDEQISFTYDMCSVVPYSLSVAFQMYKNEVPEKISEYPNIQSKYHSEWVSLSQLELTGEEPNCEAPCLGTRGVVQCPFCGAVKMSHNWKNTLEPVYVQLHAELVPKLNICIQL